MNRVFPIAAFILLAPATVLPEQTPALERPGPLLIAGGSLTAAAEEISADKARFTLVSRDKSIEVGNGFGKLIGLSQVKELGELETPILLTGTLGVWKAADAMVSWMLDQPGMEDVRSLNPVVGETNDGQLSDIRARPIEAAHVVQALENARGGPVEEGTVGAGTGTGTMAFGYKGGIGTSSRRVRVADRDCTLGALVQSNYGGDLVIAGVPVGRRLATPNERKPSGDGSIMIVLATDALMDARQPNEVVTPLFQAAVEATEEAILNSLFRATAVAGHRRAAEALPLEPVLERLRKAGAAPEG